MDKSHSHRCGDLSRVRGCGHVWAHPDSVRNLSQEDYNKAHHCPKCGKGPWRLIINPRDVNEFLTEDEPEIEEPDLDSFMLDLLLSIYRDEEINVARLLGKRK